MSAGTQMTVEVFDQIALRAENADRRLEYVTGLKVANYLAADTPVWVVDPETKTVEVYRPGRPTVRLMENETLDGDTVLQGFTLRSVCSNIGNSRFSLPPTPHPGAKGCWVEGAAGT